MAGMTQPRLLCSGRYDPAKAALLVAGIRPSQAKAALLVAGMTQPSQGCSVSGRYDPAKAALLVAGTPLP